MYCTSTITVNTSRPFRVFPTAMDARMDLDTRFSSKEMVPPIHYALPISLYLSRLLYNDWVGFVSTFGVT